MSARDIELALPLPESWLDTLTEAVSERLRGEITTGSSPWMTRKDAAEYLHVPVSRLEKDRTVPVHHWDGRVLYNRNELDEFLLARGSR